MSSFRLLDACRGKYPILLVIEGIWQSVFLGEYVYCQGAVEHACGYGACIELYQSGMFELEVSKHRRRLRNVRCYRLVTKHRGRFLEELVLKG